MSDTVWLNYCDSCPTIEHCRHAFGKFWTDKSHDGVGCMYQMSYGPDWKPPAPSAPERPMGMDRLRAMWARATTQS